MFIKHAITHFLKTVNWVFPKTNTQVFLKPGQLDNFYESRSLEKPTNLPLLDTNEIYTPAMEMSPFQEKKRDRN